MYAEERQQQIAQRARADGRVEVITLAEDFGVTSETIRRDLTVLERAGVLRRVHGGAIPVERLGFEPALATHHAVMTAEKERIAKAALAALPKEGSIIVDAGTTTGRLAQVLPTDRELTVVVNAPPLAVALASRPNLTVIMLGGRVRGRTLATVDDLALRPLDNLFVGANRSSPAHNARALEAIASGAVPVADLITHRLPLEGILEAIEIVARGEAIKVTIEP